MNKVSFFGALALVSAASASADVCHIVQISSVMKYSRSVFMGDVIEESTKKCLKLGIAGLQEGYNEVKLDLSRGEQGHKFFILKEVTSLE